MKYTWRGLNLDELTDESVGMLIDRLDGLARAADRVPAPATPAAPGLASKLRTNRGSLGSFLALVLGVVTIVVVLSAAIAALVIGASWH